jgi:hypothetical protein
MSWKKFKKYNRNAEQEEINFQWGLYCDDAYSDGYQGWEDNFWFGDMYYYYYDNPQNMGEYHQFKLLTLLRLLHIKPTKQVLEERGWD